MRFLTILGMRGAIIAFATGCVVHLALVALASYCPVFTAVAMLVMMVVALPGLLIDISSEVVRPQGLASTLVLLAAATVANGGLYVAIALLVARLAAYVRGRSPPPET